MTWEEHKWIIVIILLVSLFILLDELAYTHWKKSNPGHIYSHLFGKGPFSPVDPSRPPSVYYE